MMIERIEWNNRLIALILRRELEMEGVNFFTQEDNPIQLGILKHRQGARIKPHIHKNFSKTISEVQEVLHIAYGKIEAEFYDEKGEKNKSTILGEGDTILLLSGGHGFNILEDSKVIEVKQGPYRGVGDKELFKEHQPRGKE